MLQELKKQIQAARRGNSSYREFDEFICKHFAEICECANTRWLVSICDTYTDLSLDKHEATSALIVSTWANAVKLWATMDSIKGGGEVNPKRLKKARGSRPPLWDGMTQFNPSNGGDMTWNLFRRIRKKIHPKFLPILEQICARMVENKTVVSELNDLHGSIFKTLFS